jgi:outer membrane protein assembly factor BamB
VLIDDGRAYSLGGAGHLYCFAAKDGTVLWKCDMQEKYEIRMPNWGIAAAPLIEQNVIMAQIGGKDACVVALDKRTGQERWRALGDDASYSAPIVIDQAGQRVLVVWTAERIVGLDPMSGAVHWAHDFMWEKWPIGIATPVVHNDLLLVSDVHKGSLLLRLVAESMDVEQVWHRRAEDVADGAALHCLMSTPQIRDGHVYGADGGGVLRCLDLKTGRQLWEDRTAVPEDRWATIHLVQNGDRTWLFNERGQLIIGRLAPDGWIRGDQSRAAPRADDRPAAPSWWRDLVSPGICLQTRLCPK